MKTRSNILSKVVSRGFLAAVGVLGVSAAALADPPYWASAHGRYDHDDFPRVEYRQPEYARVVDVDPIVTRVRVSAPEQQCWNEDRPVYRGSGTVARSTIVGGLIGAAVGQRIGVHTGVHDPGTVIAGSLIGAAIGNSIGEDRAARRGEYEPVAYQSVQRCQVSYRDQWEERIDGYRVTYEYHGRRYTTRMPYDPGSRVRVDVDVRPAYDRYDD